ncbi:MAG TPA: Sapep family Mn(2+)-dependent dipeptidase [Thermoanaerobaculia bacterium]|nr:Sapep family Mn(2+)-dependent dipeptidase [Thermoanaerobaculia bacterium]
MRRALPALVTFSLVLPFTAQAASDPCREVKPHLVAGARALDGGEADGAEAFASFRTAIAESARKAGAADLAKRLRALEPGRPVPDAAASLASCLLRSYVQAAYGERMVRDLQALVGFRTFAEEGKENWKAPEFERQRKWLEQRAGELGLATKDFDGRVVEVTLPGPGPILAVLTHGDVQDVEGQQWSSPPWEARRVSAARGTPGDRSDRIVGRGTEDDKGPIVATLYALAALDDSGWPHGKTLRLLIANGEESNWEDIPYYLERAPMPDQTLGIDAAYPVTHAQKGYGVLTFSAKSPAAAAPVSDTARPGAWRVLSLAGGSGMSIIPERGEARLAPPAGTGADAALAELSRRAADWTRKNPPANLEITRTPDREELMVVAHGKGGHSSEPSSGHNALADLTAFLSTLDLQRDAWAAVALFVGRHVGTGTDGAKLGIAHRDAVMGPLTASLSYLREVEGAPAAQVNIRHPRGLAEEEMARRLADLAAAFNRESGGSGIAVDPSFLSHPHVVPAEGPLVSGLLAVWEEVTGQPGRPIAIGGGTQARLFKGGVDFGPANGMERYRGHGPDEYLTVDELHRIAELTVAALWRLGR